MSLSAKSCLQLCLEPSTQLQSGAKFQKPPAKESAHYYASWLQRIKEICPLHNSKMIHRPINLDPTIEAKVTSNLQLTLEENKIYRDYQIQFARHQAAALKQIASLEASLSSQWLTATKIQHLRNADTLANDRVNGIIDVIVETMTPHVQTILGQIRKDVTCLPNATTKEELTTTIEIIEILHSRFIIVAQTHNLPNKLPGIDAQFAETLKGLCMIPGFIVNIKLHEAESSLGTDLALGPMIEIITEQLNLMTDVTNLNLPLAFRNASSSTRFSDETTTIPPSTPVPPDITMAARTNSLPPMYKDQSDRLDMFMVKLTQMDERIHRFQSPYSDRSRNSNEKTYRDDRGRGNDRSRSRSQPRSPRSPDERSRYQPPKTTTPDLRKRPDTPNPDRGRSRDRNDNVRDRRQPH